MLLAGADGKARHHQAASRRTRHSREAMPSAINAKCGLLLSLRVSRESVVACRSDRWRARAVQAGVAHLHCRLALPKVAASCVSLQACNTLSSSGGSPCSTPGASKQPCVTTDWEKLDTLLQATLSLLALRLCSRHGEPHFAPIAWHCLSAMPFSLMPLGAASPFHRHLQATRPWCCMPRQTSFMGCQ